MSATQAINNLPIDSTSFLQSVKTFANDSIFPAVATGGRYISKAGPTVGSLVQLVVEKSPIGTICTGVVCMATGAYMAKREYKFTSRDFSPAAMCAYVALGLTGVAITGVGVANLCGLSFASPVAATTNNTVTEAAKNITAPVAKHVITVFDNNTMSAFTGVVPTIPKIDDVVSSILDAPVAQSLFDNRTMCALGEVVPKMGPTICVLPAAPVAPVVAETTSTFGKILGWFR